MWRRMTEPTRRKRDVELQDRTDVPGLRDEGT